MKDIEAVRSTLTEQGQEHLLRWYDELTETEQTALLQDIAKLDYAAIREAMAPIEDRAGVIAPAPVLRLAQIQENKETYQALGLEALRKGQVAAVLLAGGQGTRLGFDHPKGCLNVGVTRELYLFQILLANMQDTVNLTGTYMHIYIMTSEINHEETVDFFRQHAYFGYPADYVHFFPQDMAPALDHQGRILMESKSRISMAPNGNGGWFTSLQRNGMLQEMKDKGIEWLNVFSVDNVLQRIGDPVFLGAVLAQGTKVGAKVIAKTDPDEKVGAICLRDGAPSVVEYSELTDAMRTAKDAQGHYLYEYGVTLNYLFHIEETQEKARRKMPMHRANKKITALDEQGLLQVPAEPNAYKIETFIFDILEFFTEVTAFEVVREEEFAPIKNRTGVDSLDTARALLKRNRPEWGNL